jgi:transposase-like protein
MAANSTVEQQLIGKSSSIIEQGAFQREIKYKCKQCDFETTWKRSLFTHHESVHVGRRFKCEECETQFTQKGGLTKHQNSVHMGIKYP